MFYIFHGEDEFGRSEELNRLRGKLANGSDGAMADLNTSVLDGGQVTLGELRHACDTIPFLTDRRLVIVHGLLARLAPGGRGKGGAAKGAPELLQALVEYLPNLPPTTRLILVEDTTLKPSHPVLKLAQAEEKKGQGFVRHFAKPGDRELPRWIQQRARDRGGRVEPEAATILAALVGADMRLLDQEIEKLLLYAGERPVTEGDVRLLVSRARETSIFDLVDCVGRRQADRALVLLHRLLDEGEAPLYLLTMLARQIRILIQVSELRAQGLGSQAIAGRLKMHPYVVDKGLGQARNFDMAQLEAAHQCLVEADWSIKTGQSEDVLALDTLVVKLCRI